MNLTEYWIMEWVLQIVAVDVKYQRVKINDTLDNHNKILDNNPDGEPKRKHWNYYSDVG